MCQSLLLYNACPQPHTEATVLVGPSSLQIDTFGKWCRCLHNVCYLKLKRRRYLDKCRLSAPADSTVCKIQSNVPQKSVLPYPTWKHYLFFFVLLLVIQEGVSISLSWTKLTMWAIWLLKGWSITNCSVDGIVILKFLFGQTAADHQLLLLGKSSVRIIHGCPKFQSPNITLNIFWATQHHNVFLAISSSPSSSSSSSLASTLSTSYVVV